MLLHEYVEANGYDVCRESFLCGNVSLSYPFYDGQGRPEYCGYPGFEVECDSGNEYPVISVSTTSSEKFYLLKTATASQTITVAREDLWDNYTSYCPDNLYNTTLNITHYNYQPSVRNVTFYYDCRTNQFPNPLFQFSCGNRDNASSFVVPNPTDIYNFPTSSCTNNIFVPIDRSAAANIRDVPSLLLALQKGFELKWYANNTECANCLASGGVCGYNTSFSRFACFCQDRPYDFTCPPGSHDSKKKLKTTLVVTASSVVGSAMIAVALLYLKRQMDSQNIFILSKKERRNSKDVEAVLKRYGKHAPERYTYREIKQITNHFKEKLGEGGYGGVYKGKLQNGSLVAVKLLKNPDSNGTEFTNEVASISETNHVNVVTLLGYCFQGRKRALVYDFMPNGSLDKYIYSEKTQNPLSWETLHQIAIGIGRGLEYLHQGCRTRILHFDIKPHNILLDAKFCPKVSDFGLAKPYLQTKSLMTMSGTRGTPGYIAPEVFCRGFGGASHKSDVYSYGMLVLDLVGCRKNNTAGSEKTGSEQYFPHWIYKQFELEENHELQGISNDEEKVLQRKMVIVSLWCIQMNPSSRPSISRAVEMLEEDLESLQIPPMPTLSSPPKPYPENPSTNTTSL